MSPAARKDQLDEEGQVVTALLVVVAATLVLGVALFSVGRASNLRTEAQTAADAAALAAAGNLKQQLRSLAALQLGTLIGGSGVIDTSGLQTGPACAAARGFAARNAAIVVRCQRSALQVRVAVETIDTVGKAAPNDESAARRGEAEAVAEARSEPLLELPLLPAPPGLVGSGRPGPTLFAGTVDDLFRFEVRLVE